jgi:hypothetical protein
LAGLASTCYLEAGSEKTALLTGKVFEKSIPGTHFPYFVAVLRLI